VSVAGPGRAPLRALRQAVRSRPPAEDGERCEMCAERIDAEHGHVVDLHSRALMCACRPCYLLFSGEQASLRYRAVPERYLAFDSGVDDAVWDELQIPVGLAFLFRNSAQERMIAFYPGPAGATESDLPLAGWDRIVCRQPAFGVLRPDVEALLIRRGGPRGAGSCHLVPIDACYALVGQLRAAWRGFDGGQEAHQMIEAFFAGVRSRSRPAPSGPGFSAPSGGPGAGSSTAPGFSAPSGGPSAGSSTAPGFSAPSGGPSAGSSTADAP